MQKQLKSKGLILKIIGILTLLVFCGVLNAPPELTIPARDQTTLHATSENNVLLWNTTWGGSGSDSGTDLAIDANGSLYCTGITWSFGNGSADLVLVKFAPNGTRLWNVTWGNDTQDRGYGVEVDANGSIYCVGYTTSFGAVGKDLLLVKFAPNGTLLWNSTWGGSDDDDGWGVTMDANGSLYCVGSTKSFGAAGQDLLLIKFAPNGTRLWNRTWGGSSGEFARGVAVDVNGSVYCSGSTASFGAVSNDLVLIKYTPDGTRLWNSTWGGTGIDYSNGVVVDANGSIYSSGITTSFGAGGYDLSLVKFAPNGTRLWNITWGGWDDDYGYELTLGSNGSLYCTGSTRTFGPGNEDLVLIKFATDGTRLWNVTWGGGNQDLGWDVVMDVNGSLFCVGYTNSFGVSGNDLALVKFGFQTTDTCPTDGPGLDWLIILIVIIAVIAIIALVVILRRRKR